MRKRSEKFPKNSECFRTFKKITKYFATNKTFTTFVIQPKTNTMEETIKKINIALRMKGEKQNYLCDVLNLDKTQVSNRMNQKVKFKDFELDILKNEGLLCETTA